jgi:hypothetical protein
MKNVQAVEEASREEHMQVFNLNMTSYFFFALVVGNFGFPASGSGSTDPTESRNNPDPDPQHCNLVKCDPDSDYSI